MEDDVHFILLLLTYAKGRAINEGIVIESRKHEMPIAVRSSAAFCYFFNFFFL